MSSDACRGLVSDDDTDQTATPAAFRVLNYLLEERLGLGRLTVVDATSVKPEDRKPLVELARRYHVLPAAVVFDLPEVVCHERNRSRPDRAFGPHVVRHQLDYLRRSVRGLEREGFRHITILRSVADVDASVVERVPLWTDRRGETGPFDVIGDVHGCCDELEVLLTQLGYVAAENAVDHPVWGRRVFSHPAGRKAVFVGDLVDRGPRVLEVVHLVRNMVAAGTGICVPGNHDVKLVRKLRGRDVKLTHGLAQTMAEFDALPAGLRPAVEREVADFLDSLVSHFVLDGGKLVVAHAGMKAEMQGRASGAVREFALYGETTGETDEFGLPVRLNWAADYRGPAAVVYGHTPVPEPEWLNRTMNVDTGCVFGGKLTALRWPEREFVSVPAARTYAEPARPFLPVPGALTAQQHHDRMLDAEDLLGKRFITTGLRGTVTVREENAAAALEVMSRFAADPRWLVYLPPTMSPSETTARPGLLEHPAEAFAYYRAQGADRVVCEEKHMGSRAVVIVCRDAAAARERFGVADGAGAVVTRTGRPFFVDSDLESRFLERVRVAVAAAGLWDELATGWAVLDCELMPWSAKAQELLKAQYAAVGAAGAAAVPQVVAALDSAVGRLTGHDRESASQLAGAFRDRLGNVSRFVDAYRRYCWPVDSLDGMKLAPFHLLATEGQVHADKPHRWHLDTLARACAADPGLFVATANVEVDLADPAAEQAATDWWTELTGRGGEGMVVKPAGFVFRGSKGVAQPAVKCRGPEYLRIIYGPDYLAPENLSRLRQRGLGRKRSLALAEFALGVEALERFVKREPLRRVHECVFGVLALESEPVDPRL